MRAFGNYRRAFRSLPLTALAASVWMLALSAIGATAADVDPDAIVLRSRVFDIPFRMDGDSQAKLVRLYVSSDRGQSWRTAAEKPIPIDGFHFKADSDGDYWFAHATDLERIADPPGDLTPERKIYIDTSGPAIKLAGGADLDGKLSANLSLSDPHQVKSVRVLFATDVLRQWKSVPSTSINEAGDFSIQPAEDWRQMSVHITATDNLGNASVEAKTFRRPRVAALPSPRFASDNNEAADSTPTATGNNRLRAQTAAGPSDPPTFLLGTTPGFTPPVNAPSASYPPAANYPARPRSKSPFYPLQSPGSGPVETSTDRVQPTAPGAAMNSFGSGFQNTFSTQQAARQQAAQLQPAPRVITNQPTPSDFNANQPKTLPASGVTAKVTPSGIEVLQLPDAQAESIDQDVASPTTASNPELLVTPSPEESTAKPRAFNTDGPAASAKPSTASTDDPITESVATPGSGLLLNEAELSPESQRPRSVTEAMRPLSSTQRSPTDTREVIPTPTPTGSVESQSRDDERRYRVERAEQRSAEQQQRYDRAQLARSVPFRFSDSNRFSLEYELEAVGSSGVESVELFGSTDAGRTWKRWGADPDRDSPFDIETKGEGVFSFRIVVLGNNGLKSPRPLAGDDPDIAVIVDQTLPRIKITSARYGEGDRTGSLIIRYDCEDENLMNRPVAIAFSDSLEGPWTTIAAGLRNDGLYVWPADPKLPPQIYLRLDAKDQAGNIGTYVLDQPIATGGLAPRARILGFRSR